MHRHLTGSRSTGAARLQIGELARRTGCNIETIRYYEKVGVLAAPVRTEGGFRLYSADDVRRLSFIRRARELGFPLEEVRAMLRLSDERAQPCSEVKEIAIGHLADVRSKIADLRAMKAALEILVAKCEAGLPVACPLLDALSEI
jgi:MerR family mercuric resistance operon transcriptional regulator